MAKAWTIREKVGEVSPLYVVENGKLLAVTSDPTLFLHNSRVSKAHPQWLHHSYQHALMTPFAFVKAKRALSIGLGCGSLVTAAKRVCAKVDAVENNPLMLELAIRHFKFQHADSVVLSDVRNTDTLTGYDVVQVDMPSAYRANKSLYSTAAFKYLRNKLNPGGVLAMNVIGPPPIMAACVQNLLAVFERRCLLLMDNYVEPVVVCFNGPVSIPLASIKRRCRTLEEQGAWVTKALRQVLEERYYDKTFTT